MIKEVPSNNQTGEYDKIDKVILVYKERLESNCQYDLKDRMTYRRDPAGAVVQYLYDPNDRLVKEIRSNSQKEGTGGVESTYITTKHPI